MDVPVKQTDGLVRELVRKDSCWATVCKQVQESEWVSEWQTNKQTNRTNSVAWVRRRELYRLSDRRLSEKLVPSLADRGCRVVSATNPPTVVNFGILDRSPYFFEIAPQLSSRGWVDPVPDPALLRKSGSAGNQTRTSGSVARNSDH
jgi:hypothetical protein